MHGIPLLILAAGAMLGVLVLISVLSNSANLNGIKSRTIGDGQHGTARWATHGEIRRTYRHIPFTPDKWRRQAAAGEACTCSRGRRELPLPQGLLLGAQGRKRLTAQVDNDDIHCMMIASTGAGKTSYWLYPNLEYACACGVSFLALDTKGDLARNYGTVAKKYYGYQVAVIDLRNPTRSDGNNLLTLINRYMDIAGDTGDLSARAKAEKYAKILSRTIIRGNKQTDYGQNAFFYDSAEGVLTAVVLLTAEFCPPEERHIVTVFKLVQDLLAPSRQKGKNKFQTLMNSLPETHKARWFAGAALNAGGQAMQSVMSTVLSRLNDFLDSELEQVLCFDSAIDAETFASQKAAIFLILPEEDSTKNFMAALTIQNLAQELFLIADEHGGRLPRRTFFFCDELGTMPPFDILSLFSAGRSRGLVLVPIIQSLAQLEQKYGKEEAEIICDNCQDTIFGGFAPNSRTPEALSKSLGSRTVLSGSVSSGKNNNSRSLQMIERPLLTADELRNIGKGYFVVTKTGTHPMIVHLRLYRKWGITFEEQYSLPDRTARIVAYGSGDALQQAILREFPQYVPPEEPGAEADVPQPQQRALRTHRPGMSPAQAQKTPE